MKNTLTAVRLASIDRSRRGRCMRGEESQLFYLPHRPLERAACRRLHAAAAYLAGHCDPRSFCSAFAIATHPLLLLLMPPLCGSAALRTKAPLIRSRIPRQRELRLVCSARTMWMQSTFQWACRGGQSIYREKNIDILHTLINIIFCFSLKNSISVTRSTVRLVDLNYLKTKMFAMQDLLPRLRVEKLN